MRRLIAGVVYGVSISGLCAVWAWLWSHVVGLAGWYALMSLGRDTSPQITGPLAAAILAAYGLPVIAVAVLSFARTNGSWMQAISWSGATAAVLLVEIWLVWTYLL